MLRISKEGKLNFWNDKKDNNIQEQEQRDSPLQNTCYAKSLVLHASMETIPLS